MGETEDYDKSATPTAHHTTHESGGSDEISGVPPAAHKTSHQDGGADEISVQGLAGLLITAQTPAVHKTSHQDGGADEISVQGLSGTLADPQTPAAHKTSHQDAGADEISVQGLSGTLADPQTPAAHKTSHQDGGADEISVQGLSGLLADDQHVLDSEVLALVEQYLPWVINIDVYSNQKAHLNWNTLTVRTQCIHNGYRSGSGAQNNYVSWDVVLAAGTWTVSLLYWQNTDCGIVSVQFDGVTKGTIDCYGPASDNYRADVPNINVPTTKKIELKLLMATKNVSSSNYHCGLQHVILIRTA